jgi:membrane-associated protease RseP (regulator of RpoE activity)
MCPSCGTALVAGMRFCRACGYRLGEGMAEYVETVRFDQRPNMPAGMAEGNQALTGAQTTMISPVAGALPQGSSPGRRRKSRKWLVFLLMFVLFVPMAAIGGRSLFRALRNAAQQSGGRFQSQPDQPRSFFGASEFDDMEGAAGALLSQSLPGSPAERAGFVDGDIITKFDGKMIGGADAIRDALRETPVGKTVEVVFLRDGETKTTQLTTISDQDYKADAFMPKERGMLGIEDTTRVAIEGTNIYGVRVGDVYANRPADLAGIKEGDIVVEFDGKPVRTNEGFFGYINFAKPASTVNVVVYRDGQRITIPVKMGRRT